MAAVNGEVERGIASCGTGVGIGIACNKVKGIRACISGHIVRYSRYIINSNVIAFG